MKKQSLSLTVGIPTYYGGPGLVQTVRNILVSKGVDKFRLIVSVDANPLKPNIAKQLKELGVEIINNKKRGGQMARVRQIISLTKSDILITTQDDVKFMPDTVFQILKVFKDNPFVTMIGAKLKPLPATTLFERFLETGNRITHRVGFLWNKGDTYLLASGRCVAYQTKMVKKFILPNEVVNSDAYWYFENKRLGGKFKYVPNAVVFNKSPQNMAEHLKQSRRFQNSFEEIRKYLNLDLKKEYAIPIFIKIRVVIEQFIKNPFLTFGYLVILIYSRFQPREKNLKVKGFWKTDISTKQMS